MGFGRNTTDDYTYGSSRGTRYLGGGLESEDGKWDSWRDAAQKLTNEPPLPTVFNPTKPVDEPLSGDVKMGEKEAMAPPQGTVERNISNGHSELHIEGSGLRGIKVYRSIHLESQPKGALLGRPKNSGM